MSQKKKRTQTEIELQQKEESLSNTLLLLDDFAPIIPDAVTDYYLQRGGLDSSDVRLKRLLALATQKFISDICTDAMQYARIRQSSQLQKDKKAKAGKTVLTVEDISLAVQEHGVSIKKPEYFT
jgi:transcription initiation factor TFIID subunit 10